MKRCLIAIPLISCLMFFSGCVGLNSESASTGSAGSNDSGVSGGIDPITQAGIDADNATTQDQSNRDSQAAVDQINAAAAVSAN